MKRVLSLLLVAVFVLSLTVCGTATTASAQTVTTTSTRAVVPTFSVDDATALRGGEFTVAVRVANNPGVVSFKLALQYDAACLELVDAVGQDFVNVAYGPTTAVPFIINWCDAVSPDNTTNGVIANVTFRVKADAAVENTTLSLSYDPEDVYNYDWENVLFSTESGRVTIGELMMGDVNGDRRVNNRDLGVLQQYLAEWGVAINEAAADVNGDSRVNNRDLGLMQQYLTGWDVEFVTPAPSVPDTPTPPEASDPLEQVPDSLSGQKIKMMIWWNASDDDATEVALFKEQTGIEVKYETSTMDKYQTNLSGKIMAGASPQIAAIINEWYPQPITRGLMQPISNTGWDYTDDIYATSLMDQFSYKGEQYGVALKGSLSTTFEVMFFNNDMLKANGIQKNPYELWKEGNWNWETCLEIAQKCTNVKNSKYGLTLIAQWYWMLSAGQDFVLSDANGLKNNIKSGKLLESWNHAWDMIYTYKVIPTHYISQQNLFFNQQVAMLGAGSYFMQADASHSNYVPQNCKFDWGVVPFPSPKGMAPVSACEGTVWGFPVKVTGDKLQAAMWWLRYYLDDAHYTSRDFYPNEQCWEVMDWMYEQSIQSYNSVGVVCYGGMYTAWSIQYDIIDCSPTKAAVKTNLDSWYAAIDANIHNIMNEL